MNSGARRARVHGAALLAALSCLCGCAALVTPEVDGADATSNASGAPRGDYRLEIDAPEPLQRLLATHLDLARFQNAPETDRVTAEELVRLAAATPAQARALLETEGYFNAEVRVERAGADARALRLQVTPGPRTTVEAVTIEAVGGLQIAATAGDATAIALLDTLRRQWALKAGAAFRQDAWTEAKNATLARLRAEGYPAASWGPTQAQIDAQANRARLDLQTQSGPLFRLGELRIEGLQRQDASSVQRLATFDPGTPYHEKLLLDFQERLQKLGLFEGVAVEIDPDPTLADAVPVLVRVREQPLQQATFGVGVSANTGARVSFEHLHRRPFDSPWVAKNRFELGTERRLWQCDLLSHPVPGLYRNLVSASAERLRSGEELRVAGSARLGRTQDTPRIERLYFGEITHVDLTNPAGTTRSDALSANYHWIWRALDNVLLPTEGVTLSAQAALGYARSSTLSNGPFARLHGRFTWYVPLGAKWYATLRAEAGQVIADLGVGVPDTLLFRAGGDESVRGYDYRSLGPTLNGVLASGRVLATASAEIARPLSARYPQFWGALFVDAGNAAQRFAELDTVFGYGVGLRWRSPVGPLRVDLAHGPAAHRTRLHLSVGIAF